ncbi:CBS domain -containing protein, putative [Babesia ovata]|uniref:CBS domain-containing protein, putative n=1 Tax=Babesia ovata TaxID=189622 RepID=A0A2H6KDY6_9APIC|nr:CBS domain -containing protein, putative [Babesia ovata]GBE61197.1 CBS domain -containing protein, putative [Babesia ovata]
MANPALTLALVGRIGLANINNPAVLDSIKAELGVIEGQLQGGGEVSATVHNEHVSSLDVHLNGDIAAPVALSRRESARKVQINVPEVELLMHLIQEREQNDGDKTGTIASSRQSKCIQLIIIARDMLQQARDKTAWCSLLNDNEESEQTKVKWEGMPRLIALLVVTVAMENSAGGKTAAAVSTLSNHIQQAFRYSFQSPESDLCLIDHPEWAINYIRDVVKKYCGIFKLIKQEIHSNTDELFEALLPEAATLAHKEQRHDLREEFVKLCAEFSQHNFVQKWAQALAKETRWFTFTRLPLLVYEYRMALSDTLLTMQQVTNITRTADPKTRLNVSQALFHDDIRANIIYSLLRAMTDLAAALRDLDNTAPYEVFADFDKNTTIPCLELKNNADKDEAQLALNYELDRAYGALDALISLEKTAAINVVKKLLEGENILEGVKCNAATQNNWYLQDSGFLTQPVKTLIALLKMFDERCKCLETAKSRGEFTTKVIAPIINSYLEYIKGKWNAEDDVFRSCSLTAFLIDSTALLYEFLLRYPYSQYMPQVVTNVERVTTKMIAIIGDYVNDIIEEPFSRIHDKRLEIMYYLKDKMTQLAVHCSLKSYKQMLRHVVDNVEKRLMTVLLPQRASQIILNAPAHVEMAEHNCEIVYNELKNLADAKYCPEDMQVIEDVKTIVATNVDELVDAVEFLKGHAAMYPVLKDVNTKIYLQRRGVRNTEAGTSYIHTAETRITESCGNEVDNSKTLLDDILSLEESDDGESPRLNQPDKALLNHNESAEQALVEKVKKRLKVQKLDIKQVYTLSLHVLSAQIEQEQFIKLVN